MATANEDMPLPSTRTRPAPSNALLTKAGGLFAGIVFLFVGAIWFADVMDWINLGDKFAQLVAPFLLMLGGIYLLLVKMVRR
jgi:hypothetical protein